MQNTEDKKQCTVCHKWKPVQEFPPNGDSRQKKKSMRSCCRPCHQANGRRYKAQNRDAINARRREAYVYRGSQRDRLIVRWAKAFNMKPEALEAIVNHPDASCAICGKRDGNAGGKHGRLHIDHCHDTGIFRGLLCSDCNLMLGKVKDNPELLRKAAEYLEQSRQAQEVTWQPGPA